MRSTVSFQAENPDTLWAGEAIVEGLKVLFYLARETPAYLKES